MLADALTGIRVVACEQAVAAPFCTYLLAELGADVIKVERPGAGDVIRGWDDVVDGMSSGYVWVNAGKRSVAVDLAAAEGRRIVQALVARADVFVENFAPGVAQRWGLGYDSCQADNPGLVYCSLTGYGQDGPYSDVKAFDLLIQGESGLLLLNGSAEEPAKIATPIADLIAGQTALTAVLCALRERDRRGTGAYLDISMLDSVSSWLGYFPHYAWHGRGQPARSGMRHHRLAPYGPYRAGDGRYVNLAVADDRQWRTLCAEVLDRPEWIEDPRYARLGERAARRDEVDAMVGARVAERDSTWWIDRLRRSGLPYGEVREMASVVAHPQLAARRMVVEADTEVGTVPTFRSPLGDPGRRRRIPALGADTDAVLADLGYPPEDVARLRDEGVV
jgi:itaconate CoA-transferase